MAVDFSSDDDQEYRQGAIAACYRPIARLLMRLHNSQIKEALREVTWLYRYVKMAATQNEDPFKPRCCPMCERPYPIKERKK